MAALAQSDGGLELLRTLRLAGMLSPSGNGSQAPHPARKSAPAQACGESAAIGEGGTVPGLIGIWERNGAGTAYLRSPRLASEWFRWASVNRIEPKDPSSLRVIFTGESVARGWFYDPLYTPASVLEAVLNPTIDADRRVEVVDLARTSMGLEIDDLIRSASCLNPDAVVIFAGNNWATSMHHRCRDRFDWEPRLRAGGIPAIKEFVEKELVAVSRKLVKQVSSYCRDAGVPVLWLVPEYNLGDWRDPATAAPPVCKSKSTEWTSLACLVNEASSRGDFDAAGSLAERMLKIDGGISGLPFAVLAQCCKARGDDFGARKYLELARDARIWDPCRDWIPPRAHSAVQRAIREEAEAAGDACIDLPALFEEHLGDPIPDRRLFLDHCHLNAEGIQISIAAAAARLTEVLPLGRKSRDELLATCPKPSGAVESEVAFLSAIHNAHWWQSRDVIEHHCRRAIEASPHISDLMLAFLELQVRRAPRLMCRRAEEFSALGTEIVERYLAQGTFIRQRLETQLYRAVTACMEGQGVSPDRLDELDRLRLEERSAENGRIDLLDYYYRAVSPHPQELTWTLSDVPALEVFQTHDFHRSHWPTSEFHFPGRRRLPAKLTLTARLPQTASSNIIALHLNGMTLASLQCNAKWNTWDIVIAKEMLAEGHNVLTIDWPANDVDDEAILVEVADELLSGVEIQPWQTFGDIYTFTVSQTPGCTDDIPS
jgi:hypothetical protein